MSTSSSSDASIIESNNLSTNESSSGKHILEDYGALFMPYQHEHLASDEDDEETGAQEENDQPEDEDGIRPSQIRYRFERNIPSEEW